MLFSNSTHSNKRLSNKLRFKIKEKKQNKSFKSRNGEYPRLPLSKLPSVKASGILLTEPFPNPQKSLKQGLFQDVIWSFNTFRALFDGSRAVSCIRNVCLRKLVLMCPRDLLKSLLCLQPRGEEVMLPGLLLLIYSFFTSGKWVLILNMFVHDFKYFNTYSLFMGIYVCYLS